MMSQVSWWWLIGGLAFGVFCGLLPGWVTYWRLRFLLWQLQREAEAQLAVLKARLIR